MFSLFIKTAVLIVVLILLAGVVLTIRTQSGANQEQFLGGKIPASLPDGFYKGYADFSTFSWQGKNFNAAGMTGENVLAAGSSTVEKYPFTLSEGKGIRDLKLDVIRLDYDRPENPFWLRPALDEMVEVAPGTFMGKIHYRLIPYFPFSLGYFNLMK